MTARWHIAYVIPTLGRQAPVAEILESISQQKIGPAVVVVVDQNREPILSPILARFADCLNIHHLAVGQPLGSSAARNLGWQAVKADLVIFPDDDCTYPPGLIARMLAVMQQTGADLVSGRCADAAGRNANGNFAERAGWVARGNIWRTQIEWMVLMRRTVLEATGGYDPALGVGAFYGSCEGQDLTLRALAAGFRQYYDPALTGRHPDVLHRPDTATARKCRDYGRGMGHVLRHHGFGRAVQAKYMLRPLLRAGFNLARGQVGEANLALNTALGRWEGLRPCRPSP
ncbi:MAG TPA: glycosyltransferase family A protein [Gemmobacter sp.]|nr:glycosyltransferase family A protein [Gemmobacter sp.]